MTVSPPPPPAEDLDPGADPTPGQPFGATTTAWLNAGEEVAAYEAGRRAERRRMVMAIASVCAVVAALGIALWLAS